MEKDVDMMTEPSKLRAPEVQILNIYSKGFGGILFFPIPSYHAQAFPENISTQFSGYTYTDDKALFKETIYEQIVDMG